MKLKSRALLIAGITGSFCCGGALYASPYLTLAQIYQAAEHKDYNQLATFVNFPSLRESVKTNFRTLLNQEVTEQQSPIVGTFSSLINGFVLDPVVDSVVTPTGMAAILQGQQLVKRNDNESVQFTQGTKDLSIKAQYESFNQFAITVNSKNQESDPVTVLLDRDGLSWKVSGLRLTSLNFAKQLLPKSKLPNLGNFGGAASKFLNGLI